MKAYLQTSESGFEKELEVCHPDPEDGTIVIPVNSYDFLQAEAFILDKGEEVEPGTIWVRVIL
jgi:hypothetical protein